MMSGKGRMTNYDEISVTIVPLLRASGTSKQEGKGSKTKGLPVRFMLGTPGNFSAHRQRNPWKMMRMWQRK